MHYVDFQDIYSTQNICPHLLIKAHTVYCTLLVLFGFLIVRVRIIFAGDDVTDEDAITALKGMAMTFRIVSSHVRIDTII